MLDQSTSIIHELMSGDSPLLGLALFAIGVIGVGGVVLFGKVLAMTGRVSDAFLENAKSQAKLTAVIDHLSEGQSIHLARVETLITEVKDKVLEIDHNTRRQQ
jgi:hypothetical protein